jgi:hypothetical protein
MTIWYTISAAVGVETDPDGIVTITRSSPIWELDPVTFKCVLENAREMQPHARELARLYSIEQQEDATHYWTTLGNEPITEILSRAKDNDHLPDEARQFSSCLLEKLRREQEEEERIEKLQRTACKSLRDRVIERDGKKCRYCGRELPDKEIYLDHVIPYSLGGLTEYGNLVVACFHCNSKKAGKLLADTGMTLLEVSNEQ